MVASTPSTSTRRRSTSRSTSGPPGDGVGVVGVDAPAQGGERRRPGTWHPCRGARGRGARRGGGRRWTCPTPAGPSMAITLTAARPYRAPATASSSDAPRSRGTSWPRSRGRRSRCPGPAGRAGRSSSPCGGRRRSRPGPRRRRPGRTTKPSGRSSASTPQPPQLGRPPRRSGRSPWPRMKPMPVTRVGPSANGGHDGQGLGGVGQLGQVDVDPAQRPGRPVTVVASRRALDDGGAHPRRARRRTERRPGPTAAPSPATVTRPPQHGSGGEEVGGRRGVGLDRVGRRPGSRPDRPPTRPSPIAPHRAHRTPPSPRPSASTYGRRHQRGRRAARRSPSRMSGAASSSPQRNWLDTSPRHGRPRRRRAPPRSRRPAASPRARRRARPRRPSVASASSWSASGRVRSWSAPSRRKRPCPRAQHGEQEAGGRARLPGVEHRLAAPASRRPQPGTVTVSPSRSTPTPSAAQARRHRLGVVGHERAGQA